MPPQPCLFSKSASLFLYIFYIYTILFIYFWQCWVFVVAVPLFSSWGERGYSLSWYVGFPFHFSCCGSRMPGHAGCSSCSLWAQDVILCFGAQAQWLWPTGSVALQHAGSSWTWDWTRVSCIGRWILYHWATKEAQVYFLNWLLYVTFDFFQKHRN